MHVPKRVCIFELYLLTIMKTITTDITGFKSFNEMLNVLPDDQACRVYLENQVWNNGTPVCPHCGTEDKNHYTLKTKGEFKGMYKCKGCRERFTVTIGTMFEGSHIGLRKWFIAIYIFSSHKKGISSHQLARDLGVTQKSAWFMLGRIRHAFSSKSNNNKMTTVVQMDETYVGGQNKNKSKAKRSKNTQGRSTETKTPVFGMLSEGKVNTYVVPNLKAETLKPLINEMISDEAIKVTDGFNVYKGLFNGQDHKVIPHHLDEFVIKGFHTNSIEGYWSLLKRGIYGIYHHASPKHLQQYCNEFSFRFDSRKMNCGDRFDLALQIADSRLKYKELTAN